jgi:hypothetical protein
MFDLKLAVVTETHVCYMKRCEDLKYRYVEEELPFKDFTSIAQLFQLAHDKELTRLWVHLSAEKQDSLTDEYLHNCEDTCKILTRKDKKTNQYVKPSFKESFYFRGNILKDDEYTEEVGVGFLANSRCDYFVEEADTAKDVYTAFYYLETSLDVFLKFNTGNVGQSLIRNKLKISHNDHILQLKQDTQLFKEVTGMNKPFQRPLTKEEANKKWIIHIDKNAAYLAYSRINLGVGEYVEIDNPTFNRCYPGLWHIKNINGSSIFDGKMLPFPCRMLQDSEKEGWVYTPTVKILQELGYDLEIDKAKIWNVSAAKTNTNKGAYSKVLESWCKDLSTVYEDLRTPLLRFKNGRALEIAKDSLKGVYAKALSGLSHDDVYDSSIDRPDWYHEILAETCASMIRDMKNYAEIGLTPFMVVTDGLYFATDCDTVEELFKDKPLHMEKKPGHYKFVYRLPMDACKDILMQDVAVNKKINALAKVKRSLAA